MEGGESEKLKKRGWKYEAGAGLLKRAGGHFSSLIFSRFIIFTFRNYFTNLQSHYQLQDAAYISSKHLVHPAPDDDFVKLLHSLQNCIMHLKKNYFFLPP